MKMLPNTRSLKLLTKETHTHTPYIIRERIEYERNI